MGTALATPQSINYKQALEKIPKLQLFFKTQYELGEIKPGRIETIEIFSRNDGTDDCSKVPRFTVTVVDNERAIAGNTELNHFIRTCVVLLISPGREAEFQFSSKQGLQEIAHSAQCKRLLAITRNRPHKVLFF